VTHPSEDVESVLHLARRGLNGCEIARATGIPRGTVRDWVSGRIPRRVHGRPDEPCSGCHRHEDLVDPDFPAYSYLFGLYLGDGCISNQHRGVFHLRIFLDRRYPGIVMECVEAMRRVVPSGRGRHIHKPPRRPT
jgi:hypothetical protein